MAFCPSCGAPVEGSFCAACGASTAVEGSPGTTAAPASPQVGGLADNVASALCYVLGLVTGILFLVLAPYNQNRNIRFHAFQSIFLHVAVILVWYVMLFILQGFALFLTPLVGLAIFVLWLYVLYQTYQGQKLVLPIIGPLAEKQA